MKEYVPTIGLEVHAELKTETKLFCNSKNDPDETRPNVNVCPVCMGHPGTLPVINKKAIAHVLRIGAAVDGQLADYTEFDRKNYFYPDIPKGYQISQYAYPLVTGGLLAGVALTRIHLEEDTARSQHSSTAHGTGDKSDYSLVDFNRAGVPLMELVTEPVVHSAEDAGRFARELQLLLRYLGAGDANMEKGEMRVEANVSIAPAIETAEERGRDAEGRRKIQRDSASIQQQSASSTLGTKVEIKNLNSFRSVERAIAYEVARHRELLERGESVVQETRGWDEVNQKTFSQRLKEEAHDYRYFPDPDVPKLKLSEIPEFNAETIKAALPELPWQKRERYAETYGLSEEMAAIFVRSEEADRLFSEAIKSTSDAGLMRDVAHYITTEIPAVLETETEGYGNLSAGSLLALAEMKKRGDISSRGVKGILAVMVRDGGSPQTIAETEGLLQKSDAGELEAVVEQIIKEHAAVAEAYKGGKDASLQFLIGQGMKATKGAANPQVLGELFEKKLRL